MKSQIRNAYQRIKENDVVSYMTSQEGRRTVAMGTVTAKEGAGALRLALPGQTLPVILYACDVIAITRNGVPVTSVPAY